MLVRHGVRLPPRLAEIFDLIEHSGQRGILREVLAWTLFPGKAKGDAEKLVSVHINHLNGFLEETDIRIATLGRRLEPYRIIRREQ